MILQGRSKTSIAVSRCEVAMLLFILACRSVDTMKMEDQWWCISAGIYGIFDNHLYECGSEDPIAECIQVTSTDWECNGIDVSVACEEQECTAFVGPTSGPTEICDCD